MITRFSLANHNNIQIQTATRAKQKVANKMRRETQKKSGQTTSRSKKSTESTNNAAAQTTADERRLRKLKVFLKSVSYNGSEGVRFETLNNLYCDSVLADQPPCSNLMARHEYKCDPTPFLVASCFNRTQVEQARKSGNKGGQAARRTPTKRQTTTPKKTNPTKNVSSKSRVVPSSFPGKEPRNEVQAKEHVAPVDRKDEKTKPANGAIVRDVKAGEKLVSAATSVRQLSTGSGVDEKERATRQDTTEKKTGKENTNTGDEKHEKNKESDGKKVTQKDELVKQELKQVDPCQITLPG